MLPSLAFGFLLLSLFACITDRNPWDTGTLGTVNASTAFQAQFTSIEELATSSFHSANIINDLRTDSLALEDLSHAIKPKSGGLGVPSQVPARLYDLSKNADAVADALEQFYLKVTGMVELIPATGSTLEKLLRREPSDLIGKLICRVALPSAFHGPRCRAHMRLPITFQIHIDALSSSLESIGRKMVRLNQDYQNLEEGTITTLSAFGRGDLTDERCNTFAELWALSDDDEDGLQIPFRNRKALEAVCSHLRTIRRRILDHSLSIAALEDTLHDLRSIAGEGRISDDPSLPSAIAAGLERVSALREVFVGRSVYIQLQLPEK